MARRHERRRRPGSVAGGSLPNARLIRRYRFRATHRYDAAAAEELGRPHPHDWTLEVRVVGAQDARTGFLVDLSRLDAAVDEVIAGWDGGDLNELVPPVREGGLEPSTEALARWLFEALAPRVPAPASLERVGLFEGPDLGAEYPA